MTFDLGFWEVGSLRWLQCVDVEAGRATGLVTRSMSCRTPEAGAQGRRPLGSGRGGCFANSSVLDPPRLFAVV